MKLSNKRKIRDILLTISITVPVTTFMVLNYFMPEALANSLAVGVICSSSCLAIGLILGSIFTKTPRKHAQNASLHSEEFTEDYSITEDATKTGSELDPYDRLNLTGAFGNITAEC